MTGKNNSVQGLRGLFAIGVLLSHCSFTRGYPIWKWIMPLSNVGFFFMLSGYFMFLTYKDTEITKFLKKKLIRLYPLHICMTLLMVLVKLASHTFEFTFGNLLTVTAHLLLLQT